MTTTPTRQPTAAPATTATRPTAVVLLAAGVLFAIYPAVRPFPAGGGEDGIAQFASPWWLVAHLSAMLGFIALVAAAAGLRRELAGSAGDRQGRQALVALGLGVGLTLPYYGSEAFSLHALGRAAGTLGSGADAGSAAGTVAALAEDIRMGATQATVFGAGLLLVGVGAVLGAIAIARSGGLPVWSGIVLALGLATFIPQFFAGPAIRIVHGIVLALGCWLLAAALLRRERAGGQA